MANVAVPVAAATVVSTSGGVAADGDSALSEDELLARALQAQFDAEWAADGALQPAAPLQRVALPEYHASATDFPTLGDSAPRPDGTVPARARGRRARAPRRQQQRQTLHRAGEGGGAGGMVDPRQGGGGVDERGEHQAPGASCAAAAGAASTEAQTGCGDLPVSAEMDDFQLAIQLQHEEDRREAAVVGQAQSESVRAEVLAKFMFDDGHTGLPAVDGGADDDDSDEEGGSDELYMDLGGGLYQDLAGQVVSKHDARLCGERNSRRLEGHLETGGTGRGIGKRVVIGNQAFNSLKRFLDKQQTKGVSRRGRVSKAQFATKDGVIDDRTRLLLFKLVNNGYLQKVGGVVKTGKEGHVYHAHGWTAAPEALGAGPAPPSATSASCADVAVKVYRTTLTEFKNRGDYVNGDHRFRHVHLSKFNPRKVCVMWAGKEFANLQRLHRAGVPCPRPLLHREHVVLMEFIGKRGWPAPQLEEADASQRRWESAYTQTVVAMHKMYHRAKLVHADLSSYNILLHRGSVYIIDVGQAVHVTHPEANRFLAADCRNVTRFFSGRGVSTLTAAQLLAFVLDDSLVSRALRRTVRGGAEEAAEGATSGSVDASFIADRDQDSKSSGGGAGAARGASEPACAGDQPSTLAEERSAEYDDIVARALTMLRAPGSTDGVGVTPVGGGAACHCGAPDAAAPLAAATVATIAADELDDDGAPITAAAGEDSVLPSAVVMPNT